MGVSINRFVRLLLKSSGTTNYRMQDKVLGTLGTNLYRQPTCVYLYTYLFNIREQLSNVLENREHNFRAIY